MRRTHVTIALLGLAALAATWAVLRAASEHSSAPASSTDRASVGRATEGNAIAATRAAPGSETTDGAGVSASAMRPRSLRGTASDGGLLVDATGHFVPTIDARRFFDHFLVATGEVPEATIRERIVAAIEHELDDPADREAIALLDRYLTYRERVRALAAKDESRGGTVDELEARLAAVVSIRREVLGDEAADAFFAHEEGKAQHAIDARRIAADPGLSAEERRARLEELDAALPPDVRAARAAAVLADALQRAEAELRADGAAPADLQALRERMVGAEAAGRLAELDRTRAEWQGRVAAFRTERARLEQDTSLPPAEREERIERLLGASFSGPEQLRVKALDRIEAADQG